MRDKIQREEERLRKFAEERERGWFSFSVLLLLFDHRRREREWWFTS